MIECDENIDEENLIEIALFEHKNECACYYTFFYYINCNIINNLH